MFCPATWSLALPQCPVYISGKGRMPLCGHGAKVINHLVLLSSLRGVAHKPLGTLFVLSCHSVQLRSIHLSEVSCCYTLSDPVVPPDDNLFAFCS